jgi:hypothetical protein
MPDFNSINPGLMFTEIAQDVDWSSDGFILNSERSDKVGLRYEGQIYIPSSGDWSFRLSSNDGSLLYIDSQLVIDNNSGNDNEAGTITLTEGWHEIRVEYWEYIFDAHL